MADITTCIEQHETWLASHKSTPNDAKDQPLTLEAGMRSGLAAQRALLVSSEQQLLRWKEIV